ncbi:5'-methylthioadenosine/S-adenosylhomocysteine nucleosidase [Rothia sp. (in: high G+C Gram-positive bacteria)]|uniref:5'-methylthioadenosine/S-adenosylhomocysteine nucleosidase n=1 Tax=Rothia sp. (in: high G+C Gram-positive bacteria) TaxID=1885016 RepID=UPI0034CF2C3C
MSVDPFGLSENGVLGAGDINPEQIFSDSYAEFSTVSAMMESFSTAVIIQVAMDEELAPFLAATSEAFPSFSEGVAEFHPRYLKVGKERVPVLMVRSKIGLVNAASAATEALSYVNSCLGYISAGTAGGLASSINVGDIVVGNDYTYTDADATAFGYKRGQLPGMPESYDAVSALWAEAAEQAVNSLEARRGEQWAVYAGRMLAGNSFVTAHNVADTREAFPTALSTDMETTAIAQVCSNYRVPFIGVRCVSDLCGPAADQDFHMSIDIVAPRSARYALQCAAELWTGTELPDLQLDFS